MLLFAVVLVYMIMAALFESFAQPFTIMFSVPFAFFGVGIVMRLVGQPRDRMSDMGLIILAGIVVNNAIVLVDHINHLRWQGMSRDAAIVLGGQHRLRPILMTALTTILGLLPMVAPFALPADLRRGRGAGGVLGPDRPRDPRRPDHVDLLHRDGDPDHLLAGRRLHVVRPAHRHALQWSDQMSSRIAQTPAPLRPRRRFWSPAVTLAADRVWRARVTGRALRPAAAAVAEGMMGAGMGRPGRRRARPPCQSRWPAGRSAGPCPGFSRPTASSRPRTRSTSSRGWPGRSSRSSPRKARRCGPGQLLARIDDREARNQVALGTVSRDEARLAFDRAQSSYEQNLIAREAYDAAAAKLESADAQLAVAQLQLDYTRITAPFEGLVVTRYVKLAQHVSNGSPLFRLSDFDPAAVPDPGTRKGAAQASTSDRVPSSSSTPSPAARFAARVLRISPTVDAATGTLKVTLEVDGRGQLRPGHVRQRQARDRAVTRTPW